MARSKRTIIAATCLLLVGVAAVGLKVLSWSSLQEGGVSWEADASQHPIPLKGNCVIGVQTGKGLFKDGKMTPPPGSLFVVDVARPQWGKLYAGLAQHARLSPDKTQVAFVLPEYGERSATPIDEKLWVWNAHAGKADLVADIAGTPVWSPAGDQLIVSVNDQQRGFQHWLIDVASRRKERFNGLPEDMAVHDWSADDKWFAVTVSGKEEDARVVLINRSGQRRDVADEIDYGWCFKPRFSPDGSRLAFIHSARIWKRVLLVDLAGGKTEEACQAHEIDFSWAPDGKRLLISYQRDQGEPMQMGLVSAAPNSAIQQLSLPSVMGMAGMDW